MYGKVREQLAQLVEFIVGSSSIFKHFSRIIGAAHNELLNKDLWL